MSVRENFAKLFKSTAKTPDGDLFAGERPCQCSPEWPGLETTAKLSNWLSRSCAVTVSENASPATAGVTGPPGSVGA